MECGYNLDMVKFIYFSSQLRDPFGCFQQGLGGKFPESADKTGANDFKLLFEKRETGFNLFGFWVPILRRTALDDIADINIFPPQFNGLNDSG